ncbi:hypothetical protein [Pseudoalteromonas gelatinilytica]|uniref:Uncharacterized protein n=1 Tax=Pseudoalteromonas gelatinilytica TaxID=1703256 RepID=A0ABQ1TG34_9GAMM|nr:hypothetical protein [Pseudoalteromonas profundi]GGE91385.1 hypothetical protein GCM10008027_15320 [Pseudoalteromonas profundi]
MDFNNEDLKNKKANQQQNKIENTSKSFNKKLEASERQQQHEEAKAKAASDKMMQDLENLVKEAAKQQKISDFKTKSAQKLISTFKNRLATDQYFNKTVLNAFKARGRTPEKQITGRYSSVNYRAMKEGERSLQSFINSLIHSLRLSKKDVLEWEDELTKDNLYFYNKTIYKGDEFNEVNQQIFDEIIADKEADILNKDDINNKNDVKKLSTSRTNYRKKVLEISDDEAFKKVINLLECKSNKLKENDNEKIALVIKKAREMAYKRIDKLNLSPAKAEQKKRNFENFIDIRDKHIKARTTKRVFETSQTCFIQESVFKIPHKNGDLSKIEAQEYMDVAQSFFKRVCPDHPVIFGAIHLDETADPTMTEEVDQETANITKKLKCRSGDNLHFFVDGKNSKTGQYDLRKAQIDFARKEQHRLKKIYGIDFNFNEDGSYKLNNQQKTIWGQIMQVSFYTEMQKMLFKHDIALKFLNSTEKSNFDYIQSCLQEHLPLSCRQQSRWNMKQGMINKAQNELDNKNERKKELNNDVVSLITDRNNIQADVDNLRNQRLEQALKRLHEWQNHIKNDEETDGGSSNFGKLKAKAAAKAINDLADEQPEVAKKVAQSAINFEDNNNIKDYFKVSNNLNNNKNLKSKPKFKRN